MAMIVIFGCVWVHTKWLILQYWPMFVNAVADKPGQCRFPKEKFDFFQWLWMHALFFFALHIGANCRKEIHRNIRTAQQARKLFMVLFSHESQLVKACLDSVLVCRFWDYNKFDQLPIWTLTKNWSPVISKSKEHEMLDIWYCMMPWYHNVDGYFLIIEDFNMFSLKSLVNEAQPLC